MKRTANFVLKEMRVKGATLHLSFENGRDLWFLSNSIRPLADRVGQTASRDPHVVSVGDALLEGSRAQTYCYTLTGGSDV
jgi:hypothetical protein